MSKPQFGANEFFYKRMVSIFQKLRAFPKGLLFFIYAGHSPSRRSGSHQSSRITPAQVSMSTCPVVEFLWLK